MDRRPARGKGCSVPTRRNFGGRIKRFSDADRQSSPVRRRSDNHDRNHSRDRERSRSTSHERTSSYENTNGQSHTTLPRYVGQVPWGNGQQIQMAQPVQTVYHHQPFFQPVMQQAYQPAPAFHQPASYPQGSAFQGQIVFKPVAVPIQTTAVKTVDVLHPPNYDDLPSNIEFYLKNTLDNKSTKNLSPMQIEDVIHFFQRVLKFTQDKIAEQEAEKQRQEQPEIATPPEESKDAKTLEPEISDLLQAVRTLKEETR